MKRGEGKRIFQRKHQIISFIWIITLGALRVSWGFYRDGSTFRWTKIFWRFGK